MKRKPSTVAASRRADQAEAVSRELLALAVVRDAESVLRELGVPLALEPRAPMTARIWKDSGLIVVSYPDPTKPGKSVYDVFDRGANVFRATIGERSIRIQRYSSGSWEADLAEYSGDPSPYRRFEHQDDGFGGIRSVPHAVLEAA